METRALRVLMVGGDRSLWVGLSSMVSSRSVEVVTLGSITAPDFATAAAEMDVVVVVLSRADTDPFTAIRAIRDAGVHRRTVVVAHDDAQRTAAAALGSGIGGYLLRGATPERLGHAIDTVAAGGAFLDPPAAAILHRGNEQSGWTMSAARALSAALEMKDSYTGGHAERVTSLALRLARVALLDAALPDVALEAAFLLHDVGKIGIPESILIKPGPLTETERRVMETHPMLGERIVSPLGYPACVIEVIRHHHERWDGRGYPDRLAGHDIPAAARVFAIADSLDAMTSLRAYRRPVSFPDAVAEIVTKAGTQFDPELCALVEQTFLGPTAGRVLQIPA